MLIDAAYLVSSLVAARISVRLFRISSGLPEVTLATKALARVSRFLTTRRGTTLPLRMLVSRKSVPQKAEKSIPVRLSFS